MITHCVLQGCDDEAVCAYFRAVGSGLAERQLQHYHFKICNGRFDVRTKSQAPKWYCTVFYGAQDATEDASALRNGPIQVRVVLPEKGGVSKLKRRGWGNGSLCGLQQVPPQPHPSNNPFCT